VFSVDHSSDNTSNVKFKKDIRRIIAQCIPATMRNSTIMILRKKSFHLHLQHPKQHLSMPKLCSKPKQLRERLEKDRAGRFSNLIQEIATFQREDHGNLQKKSREPGRLAISSTSSGRINVRSTHFVGWLFEGVSVVEEAWDKEKKKKRTASA
jgi:hypothetical protein